MTKKSSYTDAQRFTHTECRVITPEHAQSSYSIMHITKHAKRVAQEGCRV